MGGPAYDFDARTARVFRWPQYYDGVPLFYEWTRDYVKEFRLNRPDGGRLDEIRPVVPSRRWSTTRWTWSSARTARSTCSSTATGYFAENPDAQLARIDFVRGNHTPVVKVGGDARTAGRRR